MIDARTSSPSGGTSQQKLTDDQIVAHSTTFLVAGYETTSTALAYVSYQLALNPTIQEKLQQEIDNYFDNNPVMKYSMSLLLLTVPTLPPRIPHCTRLLRR